MRFFAAAIAAFVATTALAAEPAATTPPPATPIPTPAPTPGPMDVAEWVHGDAGDTAIVSMKNAPYPHSSRENGFKTYTKDPNYIDPSVGLFVPKGYKVSDKTDLLVYFHGHNNNVRKALDFYHLREQVEASGKNVILVFPEGPKDAADSGGGKMEDQDGLKNLLTETMTVLKSSGKANTEEIGHIIVTGHSGGYFPIAMCLSRGGMDDKISEAWLLDAAYGNLDSYTGYMQQHPDRRFRSIFTEHLANENVQIMATLGKAGLDFDLRIDTDADESLLKTKPRVFLHTLTLKHDETVQWLEKFLKTSSLTDR
ncbi:hypothetical protein BH09SUM1_BH09SUM1_15190 [soil metagenome]